MVDHSLFSESQRNAAPLFFIFILITQSSRHAYMLDNSTPSPVLYPFLLSERTPPLQNIQRRKPLFYTQICRRPHTFLLLGEDERQAFSPGTYDSRAALHPKKQYNTQIWKYLITTE